MRLNNTPVTHHTFNGYPFYLKRDDQLHPEFSGNKARKLMSLLEGDFPQVNTLIGYGSPQANSLYSLAALAKLKGWKLEFYVSHIPSWLRENPIGNYQAALSLNAKIIDLSQEQTSLHPHEYITQVRQPDDNCLFVPEGGRSPIAEYGIQQLAEEILHWQDMHFQKHRYCENKEKKTKLTVALPSGTGTTALYLHKHLKQHDIKVITCACVGGNAYLTQQFHSLGEQDHPEILSIPERTKHQFGKLYLQDHQIWQDLKQQTHIEFDLLYDPFMWHCLQNWCDTHQEETLLYIHQGGLLGNVSMIKRYQRKNSF